MAIKSFAVFLQENTPVIKKRGRPAKDRSNEEPKIAGKRGRPKGASEDSEKNEGIRQVVLVAKITHDEGDEKDKFLKTTLKIHVDDINKAKKDWKKDLMKKFPPETYDIEVAAPDYDARIFDQTQGASAVDFDIEYGM